MEKAKIEGKPRSNEIRPKPNSQAPDTFFIPKSSYPQSDNANQYNYGKYNN